jgi:hypothetical protein
MYPGADYARSCPICGYIDPPKQPWDDSLPATYCPNDGLRLERMACCHCDAPVQLRHIPGWFGGRVAFASICTQCGQPVDPVEPKWREKRPEGGGGLIIPG